MGKVVPIVSGYGSFFVVPVVIGIIQDEALPTSDGEPLDQPHQL